MSQAGVMGSCDSWGVGGREGGVVQYVRWNELELKKESMAS